MSHEATELIIAPGSDAFDPEEKYSFFNMLPEDCKLLGRVEDLRDEIARGYSDAEFKKSFGHDKNYPLMRRLRISFWNLYNEQSTSKNPRIQQQRIYSGICSRAHWLKLLDQDLYCTFLFTQPHDVSLIQQDLLYEGYRHLEEILEQDIKDDKGNINSSLVGHKIKIIEMMENRVKGSIVQRTQTYSEEVRRDESVGDKAAQLQEEIRQLREQMGKPAIVEVVDE